MVSRKAASELAAALSESPVLTTGSAPADVFIAKGTASPLDLSRAEALAGEDGVAVRKALAALGWDTSLFGLCVSAGETALEPASLALAIEAVDPDLVIAVDETAALSVAAALGADPLVFGTPRQIQGRSVLAVDGLEDSLADDARKRRVWQQLKSVQRD
jgi:hypothetical protein